MTTMFEFQATVRADASRALIIDFSNVPYVDSAGIGALVGAYVTRQKGGRSSRAGGRLQAYSRCPRRHPSRAVLPLFRFGERSRTSP